MCSCTASDAAADHFDPALAAVAFRFGQTVRLGDGGAPGPLAVTVATEGAQSGLVSSFTARFDPDGVCRSAPLDGLFFL